jgi:hypothetical protein
MHFYLLESELAMPAEKVESSAFASISVLDLSIWFFQTLLFWFVSTACLTAAVSVRSGIALLGRPR